MIFRILSRDERVRRNDFGGPKSSTDLAIGRLQIPVGAAKAHAFRRQERTLHSDVAEAQLSLFHPPAQTAAEEQQISVPAHDRKKTKAKKHPIRLVLPEHLKREETIIEPEGVDLTDMVRIGEERTETLHYTPAELTVKVIVRPKYAPKTAPFESEEKNGGPILIAELPSRFIDKCIDARLPDHPVNRIEELLPHLWKKN